MALRVPAWRRPRNLDALPMNPGVLLTGPSAHLQQHAQRSVWLRWALACALVAGASLWLRQGFAAHAVAAAGFDDALFVRLAYSLSAGQWLGPFDRVTLAKGMGYPLFIALSAALSVPLKLAEQAIYLAVCALLSHALGQRLRRPGPGLLLFAALAFNPVMWHPELARIIREGLYLTQSLAVLGLAAALLVPRQRQRGWPLALLAGGVLAIYWCTREEGVWLLPALAAMAAAVLLAGLRRRRRAAVRHAALAPTRVRLLRSLIPLLVAGLVAALGVAGVKALNYARYGVFLATEFQDARFKRAYGALARIRHDQRRPYVVFPADARARAYAASPAARELQPAFEGDNSALWRHVGCTQLNIAAADCPEVLSGWCMWALRDAVWLAGHYESAPRAMAFYERLSTEINAACDSGKLACEAPRHGLAPAFDPQRLGAAAQAARWLTRALVQLGDGQIGARPSLGRLDDLEYLKQMVGRITPPSIQNTALRLQWDSPTGAPVPPLRIEGRPAPQWRLELQAGDDPRAQQLRLLTDCTGSDCRLALGDAALALTPGTELRHAQGSLRVADVRLHARTLEGQRTRAQQAAARLLAKAYAWAWPLLTLVALLGWALAVRQWLLQPYRRNALPWMLLLASAALAAVATRIALLAWLDAIAIPSTTLLYAAPASPMVLVFTVLGLLLGREALRGRASGRRPPSPQSA